jgi:hypothetical protein
MFLKKDLALIGLSLIGFATVALASESCQALPTTPGYLFEKPTRTQFTELTATPGNGAYID